MYIIYAMPKIIKLLIPILTKKGFIVRETKLKEYIAIRNDPSAAIPDSLRTAVKIEQYDGNYFTFLKNAGVVRDILNPPKLKAGTPVRITGGMYKDFKGIIKRVNRDNTYKLEIGVWGQMVTADVEAECVEYNTISYLS